MEIREKFKLEVFFDGGNYFDLELKYYFINKTTREKSIFYDIKKIFNKENLSKREILFYLKDQLNNTF